MIDGDRGSASMIDSASPSLSLSFIAYHLTAAARHLQWPWGEQGGRHERRGQRALLRVHVPDHRSLITSGSPWTTCLLRTTSWRRSCTETTRTAKFAPRTRSRQRPPTTDTARVSAQLSWYIIRDSFMVIDNCTHCKFVSVKCTARWQLPLGVCRLEGLFEDREAPVHTLLITHAPARKTRA